MIPDFTKNTIETVAKRAGYICSNPDCRAKTIGPNSDKDKTILIGEAAHISGARSNSKRYDPLMTDLSRAEITNAIWLCRNCHKIADSDAIKYDSVLLFKWREIHENHILSELGTQTDQIQNDELQVTLAQFSTYPAIIRRIITDRPDGWELRVTAELMRFLNRPHFRKLKDLRNNLYLKPQRHIVEDEAFDWVSIKLDEATKLVEPIVNLIDKINEAWGPPGQEGNVNEIHHLCKLVSEYLEQIVIYEESIWFTNVPEEYEKLHSLLQNIIGSQVLKIESVPDQIEHLLSLAIKAQEKGESKTEIKEELTLEFPKELEDKIMTEMERVVNRQILGSKGTQVNNDGCLTSILIIAALILFALMV